MRDILPAERPAWALVERAARRAANCYGYQEIEVPIVEPAALIERGVGGDSDVGSKEIYRLQAFGEEDDGAGLALRPEATAGVVRAYFEGGLNQGPQPVRLVTLGPMFRHDRPQKGRYRQFHQFDLEVIGDPSPAYDAEIVEMTWGWLAELGVAPLSLELNSIGDAVCRPAYLDLLRAYYRPLRSQLGPDCARRLEKNPLRLLDCKESQCQPLRAGAPSILDHLCPACAAHFAEVRGLLDAAGIGYRLNPHLVRGLDYYTRTVFELQHENLGGAQNALGGGGRYDGLAAALGYPDTPGVGFAGGLERTVLMLPEAVPAGAGVDVLVLPDGEGLDAPAAALGRALRAGVPTAVDFSRRSLKAKMRAAGRSGARWVAILDPEEAGRGTARLRDLESGEQRELPWAALAAAVAGS